MTQESPKTVGEAPGDQLAGRLADVVERRIRFERRVLFDRGFRRILRGALCTVAVNARAHVDEPAQTRQGPRPVEDPGRAQNVDAHGFGRRVPVRAQRRVVGDGGERRAVDELRDFGRIDLRGPGRSVDHVGRDHPHAFSHRCEEHLRGRIEAGAVDDDGFLFLVSLQPLAHHVAQHEARAAGDEEGHVVSGGR